jgi:hypothetical protein
MVRVSAAFSTVPLVPWALPSVAATARHVPGRPARGIALPTAHRGRFRSAVVMSAAPLPSKTELQSATFLESVRHAETLLGFRTTDLAAENVVLLETMLQSSNGARGFFVALLSQPDVLLAEQDPLPAALVSLLFTRCGDAVVADLIVKNAVMSSAMALQYEGQGETGMAVGSASTSQRALTVLQAAYGMPGSAVPLAVELMISALEGAAAEERDERRRAYIPFVKKWGYDDAQRKHCASVLWRATSV